MIWQGQNGLEYFQHRNKEDFPCYCTPVYNPQYLHHFLWVIPFDNIIYAEQVGDTLGWIDGIIGTVCWSQDWLCNYWIKAESYMKTNSSWNSRHLLKTNKMNLISEFAKVYIIDIVRYWLWLCWLFGDHVDVQKISGLGMCLLQLYSIGMRGQGSKQVTERVKGGELHWVRACVV